MMNTIISAPVWEMFPIDLGLIFLGIGIGLVTRPLFASWWKRHRPEGM